MGHEVCLQCGDEGIINAQVYCVKCLEFFVHRYCLGVIPETLDEIVFWVCDACEKEPNKSSLGKREAPCQASTEDMEIIKDNNNSVDFMGLTEKCVQLENQNSKYNLQQKANLLDESLIVQKLKEKRRLICSTKDKDVNSLGKDCKTIVMTKHAKSASESILPNEASEKEVLEQRDQNCSSDRPCESNPEPHMANHTSLLHVSFKNAKEDAPVSSPDMTYEDRSFSPRDELNAMAGARLIVPYHKSNFGESFANDSLISSEFDPGACAEPIAKPVWRGSFLILNRNQPALDGLMAHMSSKACQKVCVEANMFETVLQLEMVPKADALPKSFKISPPSSGHIALYFFPSSMSERLFDNLVDDMRKKELAMKGTTLNAELLLFSSTELPLAYWRFQSKYYIWGVFRAKQPSPSQPNSPAKLLGKTIKRVDTSNRVIYQQ